MLKQQQITHLQNRLSSANNKKQVVWSLADRSAVSSLLIEMQQMVLREKALILIEHIAVHCEDDWTSMVYRAAHAANDMCLNSHKDWKEEVEKSFDDLVARGEHEPDKEKYREKLLDMKSRMEAMHKKLEKEIHND